MSNFCTLPLPPFFCLSEWIRIGQDLPPPAPGQDLTPSPRPWLKLRLPTTPPHPKPLHPHSFWYSCSISIIFSRRFHQIPCPCYSKLFTTKNQYKLNSIFWSNTQAKMSHLEC